MMRVPEELARLLGGEPDAGAAEQAFPFLTLDEAGFPHASLLSRAETGVTRDGREVLAVAAGPRTRSNLRRDGRACLIAIDGATAYYAKLRVVRTILAEDPGPAGGLEAFAMTVVEHKADTLGVPLTPVTFTPTPEIARAEHWDVAAVLLRRLAG